MFLPFLAQHSTVAVWGFKPCPPPLPPPALQAAGLHGGHMAAKVKRKSVSEKQAVASIACALDHAEDADMKYIIKKLNEMPKAKSVLAGLLRDGTFQKSIMMKDAGQSESSTLLPLKYKKFRQLGLRFMLELVGMWEAGLEPGERLPSKGKKSQKEIMEEVLTLAAYALHMKVDAKIPSHDGNKVKQLCLERYKEMGSRLDAAVGNIDFSFKTMGHYRWDPEQLKVVVMSWSTTPEDQPKLDLSMPEEFLKDINDFQVEGNYQLDASLKSESKNVSIPLMNIFKKQYPDNFKDEVIIFPTSTYELEEQQLNVEGGGCSASPGLPALAMSPLKTIPSSSPSAGEKAKAEAKPEGTPCAKKAKTLPPPGDGRAADVATPQ